jgi:hypothetical protein
MKLSVRSAVSAALLTVAAVSAHAQISPVPTPPSLFPTDGTISPGGGNLGNGGVLVQAFDPLTGKSLTEYLGINFNSFLPANIVSAAGGTTDFGVIGGSTLWSATFSGDTNPIDFIVVSANAASTGSISILTTLSPGSATTTHNSPIAGAAAKFASAIGGLTAGAQANAGQAAGVNPAQTLATTDNGYIAVTNLGTQFGSTFQNIFGTAGGPAVNFYQFTQTSASPAGVATSLQYANANGAATFSLDTSGDLVFTVPGGGAPVPLPAAAWLLGSGLLGLAGIGRRRAAAKA